MSQVPSTSTPSTDFETIFSAALKAYKKQTKKDIASHPLATELKSCDSSSAILTILRTQAQNFDQSQGADEKWTKWLDPTVNVLFAFSATLGNGVGVAFPPANAIFTGIGVLLQAIKDVRASKDALLDLFHRMEYFFKRLEAYIKVRPTAAMRDIIVKIMVEVIAILGIVTKEIRQGRTKRYLKQLFGIKDVEDALQRLDKLTQEEARMATAESLIITRGIDDTVKDVDVRLEGVDERVQNVDTKVEGLDDKVLSVDSKVQGVDRRVQAVDDKVLSVDNKVQGVDSKVQSVDDKVQGVDNKVQGVDNKVQGVDNKVQSVDDKVLGIDCKVQGVDYKVSSIIDGARETGVAIQHVVNQVSVLNRNELRKELRRWIAPPDPSVNYNAASASHHEGTASWCTKGQTLADWKASGSLLWIHGKPGSGKSILSSVIIQDIQSLSKAGSACMAYFFFDFKDTGKQDSRALLSSLLVQLSDQSEPCCDILIGLHSAHQNGSQQPTDDSLVRCLKDMLTIMGQVPIYLIVDALDECPNDLGIPSSREKVLNLVNEVVELRLPNLRLCITSRPEFDIRTTLGPLATQQVSLHDESGQKQDIIDYVTSVVRSDGRMKRWREDDKTMVIGKLTEKADGMFRWVFCQLEVLRHCFPSNLRHTLEELPKSLDETYKRILNEINNANQRLAYRLLQCLTVALRPLRVEELAEVLAFDLAAGRIPKLNANWRWEDQEEAVLSACSSLVSVIIDDDDFRVVQFSHFSVKEFLTSDRLASCAEVSQFHIPIEPSHSILSQACLGVLLCLDDHSDKDSVERIPLYRYATEYWVGHAQVGNVESQIKGAMDYFFDMDNPQFSAWVRLEHPREFLRVSNVEEPTGVLRLAAPLYFAALKGFRGLVERLIDKHPQQVTQFGGLCGTPLHASVYEGHLDISQLLFTQGADINSRCGDNWTPLHVASYCGQLKIGKWLLNHGADANAKERCGRSPLHFAASRGYLDFCRILLEHNAEVNSRTDDGSTPFLIALGHGHHDIARLFLDHDADVHVHDNSGDTPQHFAASSGHLEIVQSLLERNSEIDARNNDGYTPFLRALESGHPDVARLLLDHNVDVHAHNKSGNSPLHFAAKNGHLKVAQILLDRNVDVNSRGEHGYTPLLLASKIGNSDIAQSLLDHSAEIRVQDSSGNSPLHLAAEYGHLDVAQILLKHNAEVDSRDDHGCTPLRLASHYGYPDIVQLLLDHNADIFLREGNGDTALHSAVLSGHLEASRVLLDHNSEVNSQNDEGSTPLHYASLGWKEGFATLVRLLLDYGADAQARNLSGNTASEVARGPEQEEIVRLISQHIAE